jgi:hypothetical protein
MAKSKTPKNPKGGRKTDPYSFPFGANASKKRKRATGGGSWLVWRRAWRRWRHAAMTCRESLPALNEGLWGKA